MAEGIKELFVKGYVKGSIVVVEKEGRVYGLKLLGDYKNNHRYYKCQLRTGEKHRTYLGAVMAIEAAKIAAEEAAKERDRIKVKNGASIIAGVWGARLT